MVSPTPAPAAADSPAPAAPETISASVDAVNRGDFDAFDRAELGKRTGAPVADVPVVAKADPATVADPAVPGEPKLSRKEREQHEANERTRKAVEAATADLRAEVERLKVGAAPRSAAPAPAAPAPPAEKGTPEYKRLMALPDAPKLEDYESVAEHAFAAAAFIDTVRTNEREQAARSRASQDALLASEKAADDAFFEQLEQAKTADPEFTTKVAPEVLALTPVEWLPRDKEGRPLDATGRPMTTGPLNVVASELRKSPVVRDLMLHFSQHPAELAKFAEVPPAVAAIADPRVRLRAHIQHIVREFHRLEGRFTATAASAAPAPVSTTAPAAAAADTATRSPITAAPPPPPTLRAAGATSDPKAAALARGDFAEFDRLELQERMAQRTPAR